MKLELIELNKTNKVLLEEFVSNLGEARKSFRYFEKRPLDIIAYHIYTIGVTENEVMVGYGHLEKENEKVWLGISVLPTAQGRGVGKFIMTSLIDKGYTLGLKEIFLTVDKDNYPAIELYKKFYFSPVLTEMKYLLFRREMIC